MYIVNTSFIVDYSEDALWREFIVGSYIPMLRREGFEDIVFTKMISDESPGTFTYSLQVGVPDMDRYRRLTGEIFGRYQAQAGKMFGHKVLHFISLLKHVDF